MNNPIKTITDAGFIVFKPRSYLLLGVLSFAVFFVLYSFVLPATYTGGRVGFVSLQFLNIKLGTFALLFSFLLALIVPFAVYAFRKRAPLETKPLTGRASQETSTTAGSIFGSVLPPLLCCSPFLPSVAALIGGTSPFAFRVSGLLQGFIATYETQIYAVIVAILTYSVWQNARQVVAAERQLCDY